MNGRLNTGYQFAEGIAPVFRRERKPCAPPVQRPLASKIPAAAAAPAHRDVPQNAPAQPSNNPVPPPVRRDAAVPDCLREFYPLAVNATRAWQHCAHRACLRAKRCTGQPPACFETHAETFREFMRARVAAQLRAEIQ